MIGFTQVPPAGLGEFWTELHRAFRHIEKRSGGLWTVEGIVRRAQAAEWQIWLIYDTYTAQILAVAASCLTITDADQKWAEMLFCTGAKRELWQDKIAEFEAWARDEGCTRVRSIARLGWAKTLPGYRTTHAFIEKDLTQ